MVDILFSSKSGLVKGMREPKVLPRHFPQWSRTAILTLSGFEDEELEVKKSPPDPAGSGFIISGDAAARVTHLEHSVRFLQEQHRLMLSGLHAEIEALRERNRDLQFQLIFNKESSTKAAASGTDENAENTEEAKLKREVSRLEKEAAASRSEARAAEARALQLQRLVDAQAEKLRELEILPKCSGCGEGGCSSGEEGGGGGGGAESRGALRMRLAEAEALVRRLRADADRRRREVQLAPSGGVTNLLYDNAAARHAHLQCMKNSLHASLRATALDGYGYQNNYHFPPVHTPDFWREPVREDFSMGRGRNPRRPLTLPELSGHQIHRSTVYANNHTRPRANGYENKNKKPQPSNGEVPNGKTPEEQPQESRFCTNYKNLLPNINDKRNVSPDATYPELKIVVTKLIPHCDVSTTNVQSTEANGRTRPRRHRKHADHT